MKKDKKLEKYASERLSALGNEEFLSRLREKVPEKTKTSAKARSLIAALSGTIAVAVIVAVTVICVALVNFGDDVPGGGNNDFLYTASKADFSKSTLEELNGETTFVDLFVRSADSLDVVRYFDLKTGETKYYVVNISSDVTRERATVCVVVNGYGYGGAMTPDVMTNSVDLEGFTVLYNYGYYPVDDGYICQYCGIIDTGTEKIYIWYSACSPAYDGFYAFAATMFRNGEEE